MKHVFMLRLGELIDGRDIADFARYVGLNTETVRRYTTGERIPKGDFLYALCKSTGVSSDWLLGLSDVRDASRGTPGAVQAPADQEIDVLRRLLSDPSASVILRELDAILKRSNSI